MPWSYPSPKSLKKMRPLSLPAVATASIGGPSGGGLWGDSYSLLRCKNPCK